MRSRCLRGAACDATSRYRRDRRNDRVGARPQGPKFRPEISGQRCSRKRRTESPGGSDELDHSRSRVRGRPSGCRRAPFLRRNAIPIIRYAIIVPFAAGGPPDVISRIVAQKLSEAGASRSMSRTIRAPGGNTGTATAARAAPDGYTLYMMSTGFMVNPSLYAKVPYDPIKDFAPVTLAAASPNILFVHPSVKAYSVMELIELIRRSPGQYSYAQPSTGSTPHLSGELFKLRYKLDLVTVALQRRFARGQFDHCGAHPGRLHGTAARGHQHQGRQFARACRHGAQAHQGAAGCTHDGGGPACPTSKARRSTASWCRPERPRRSSRPSIMRRWRRCRSPTCASAWKCWVSIPWYRPGRVRRPHQERDCQMGPGGACRQHQNRIRLGCTCSGEG